MDIFEKILLEDDLNSFLTLDCSLNPCFTSEQLVSLIEDVNIELGYYHLIDDRFTLDLDSMRVNNIKNDALFLSFISNAKHIFCFLYDQLSSDQQILFFMNINRLVRSDYCPRHALLIHMYNTHPSNHLRAISFFNRIVWNFLDYPNSISEHKKNSIINDLSDRCFLIKFGEEIELHKNCLLFDNIMNVVAASNRFSIKTPDSFLSDVFIPYMNSISFLHDMHHSHFYNHNEYICLKNTAADFLFNFMCTHHLFDSCTVLLSFIIKYVSLNLVSESIPDLHDKILSCRLIDIDLLDLPNFLVNDTVDIKDLKFE